MKKHFLICYLYLIMMACNGIAQAPNFNALNTVPEYKGGFRPGVNFGYYPYYDTSLADLAAGKPSDNVEGIGAKSIRPSLPEIFLDTWGYDIRLDAFQHYDSVGLEDNVVFVGYPTDAHRDKTVYCGNDTSNMFANMYLPIWDNGENGTPVNDENYYALYLWKTATKYGKSVRFWEIWNEPDYDVSGNAWKTPNLEGNWWHNEPKPCDMAIKAPVFHYVRLLRISYEVIKSIDPDDYVCVGGLGYPSFLDAIIRYSDNPNNGLISEEYPLSGGAYFDVLSYHSYPHIDGSLRYWSDEIMNFKYKRHSDAAVDGILRLQNEFVSVLKNRGFDGNIYPEKHTIITECNIPRKEFGDYIGTMEAQRNFLMKAYVICAQNDIWQLHIYQLSESRTEAESENEFGMMGLYEKFKGGNTKAEKRLDSGVAYKTTSDLLFGKKYNQQQTNKLHLPDGIRGGAFKGNDDKYTYVLWAETSKDKNESALKHFDMPASIGTQVLDVKRWDYAVTGKHTTIGIKDILLDGSPIFLTPITPFDTNYVVPKVGEFVVFPNPSNGVIKLQTTIEDAQHIRIDLLNAKGQLITTLKDEVANEGFQQYDFNIAKTATGVYFLKITLDKKVYYKKIML